MIESECAAINIHTRG